MKCKKCGRMLLAGISAYCSFCEPLVEPKHGHPNSSGAVLATDLHLKTVDDVAESEIPYTLISNGNQAIYGSTIYNIVNGVFIRAGSEIWNYISPQG